MKLTEILTGDIDVKLAGKKPKRGLWRSLVLCLGLFVPLYSVYHVKCVDRQIEQRTQQVRPLIPVLNSVLGECIEDIEKTFGMRYNHKPELSGDLGSVLEVFALNGESINKGNFFQNLDLRRLILFHKFSEFAKFNPPVEAVTNNNTIYCLENSVKRVKNEGRYTLSHELGHIYISQVNPSLEVDRFQSERDWVYKCVDEGAAEYIAITIIRNRGSDNLRANEHLGRKTVLLEEGISTETLRYISNQYALGYTFLTDLIGTGDYNVNGVNFLEKILQNPPSTIEELVHPTQGYAQRLLESFSEEERARIKGF